MKKKLAVIAMSMICMQSALAQDATGQSWSGWLYNNLPSWNSVQMPLTTGAIGAAIGTVLAYRNPAYRNLLDLGGWIGGAVVLGALSKGVEPYVYDDYNQYVWQPMRGTLAKMVSSEEDPSIVEGNNNSFETPLRAIPSLNDNNDNVNLPPPFQNELENININFDQAHARLDKLENDIQRNDKKAMQGIAAVAALGNAVIPAAPGKTIVGAGVANYEGKQALGINMSHRPEAMSQMSVQAGMATSSGGKPVIRLGASYEF
jgi:16S rRNA G966 N2-methylase RsmD